jgi:hypothetical protein
MAKLWRVAVSLIIEHIFFGRNVCDEAPRALLESGAKKSRWPLKSCSRAPKRSIILSLPAFDAMLAAWPTMKQPQIQRSRVYTE